MSVGRLGRKRQAESHPPASLAGVMTDPEQLCDELQLGSDVAVSARAASATFGLRVPRGFVDRMERGNLEDPLLRQVLPVSEELDPAPGFVDDPLEETAASPLPGVLHKYRGRALLMVSGACAVHCRYCFRRHFPYGDHQLVGDRLSAAIDYLESDPSIREVILSGGDPLSATNAYLADLVGRLSSIRHLRWLRVHTRMPIVLPQRIDDRCLDWLTGSRLRPLVVVHCNHANEIGAAVLRCLTALRSRGVLLLNQSVLLAGVNDSVDALCELSHRLVEAGVMPYYLHLLDPVAGAAHFEVTEETARELMVGVAARLPGYLVPRLVREVAGAEAKLLVSAGRSAILP